MISPSMRFLDVGKFLHAQNERERITLAHMLQTSSVMLGGDDQDLSDHGGNSPIGWGLPVTIIPISVTWPMLSHDFMLFIAFLLFIDRVDVNLLTISPGGEWF